MSPALTYAVFLVAILLEIIGTSCLQASQQFTKPLPTAVMVVSYIGALYLLSLVLRTIPVGIAYATWSGLGIILISIIGLVVFGQKLDWAAVLGISLIVAGVVLVNVFSSATVH
jgi:small multidrug resistance pump